MYEVIFGERTFGPFNTEAACLSKIHDLLTAGPDGRTASVKSTRTGKIVDIYYKDKDHDVRSIPIN